MANPLKKGYGLKKLIPNKTGLSESEKAGLTFPQPFMLEVIHA
jgi:hypothetical protein